MRDSGQKLHHRPRAEAAPSQQTSDSGQKGHKYVCICMCACMCVCVYIYVCMKGSWGLEFTATGAIITVPMPDLPQRIGSLICGPLNTEGPHDFKILPSSPSTANRLPQAGPITLKLTRSGSSLVRGSWGFRMPSEFRFDMLYVV